MRRVLQLIGLACTAAIAGCATTPGANPFLAAAEFFGITASGNDGSGGGGGGGGGGSGGSGTARFRDTITLTLVNNAAEADLNVSFAAWVTSGSIRSADQQDALIAGGYVLLTREVQIGTVFTLAPGTFVFNGPGLAGATPLVIGAAGVDAMGDPLPSTRAVTLITPDVLLVYSEPPRSCESVAFSYTVDGFPLEIEPVEGGLGEIFQGATGSGPRKTLAQIDAYQCQPLRPGLFLRTSGGARQSNEFIEGEDITIDFFLQADANGRAATVSFN